VELDITDEAAEEFKKSVEDINPEPYLRIGATKGGCSGWTFTLGTEEQIDPTDSLYERQKNSTSRLKELNRNLISELVQQKVDVRVGHLL